MNLHLSVLHDPELERVQPSSSFTVGEFAVASSNVNPNDWWPFSTVKKAQSSGDGFPWESGSQECVMDGVEFISSTKRVFPE